MEFFAAAIDGSYNQTMRKTVLFLLILTGAAHAAKTTETYPQFGFDLGAAAGGTSGSSFFEINLGVNALLNPWLVVREAPFYRFRSNQTGVVGLDSSLLGRAVLGDSGVTLLGGGGYRLATQGLTAPFLEGGLTVNVSRLALHLGVKYLFNSVHRPGASNDFIYSVGASAGARL